jgi:hypothetical protein
MAPDRDVHVGPIERVTHFSKERQAKMVLEPLAGCDRQASRSTCTLVAIVRSCMRMNEGRKDSFFDQVTLVHDNPSKMLPPMNSVDLIAHPSRVGSLRAHYEHAVARGLHP